MTQLFGRLFQLIGMAILPVALYVGLARNDVRMEVKLLFIGAGIYLVGWLMARKVE